MGFRSGTNEERECKRRGSRGMLQNSIFWTWKGHLNMSWLQLWLPAHLLCVHEELVRNHSSWRNCGQLMDGEREWLFSSVVEPLLSWLCSSKYPPWLMPRKTVIINSHELSKDSKILITYLEEEVEQQGRMTTCNGSESQGIDLSNCQRIKIMIKILIGLE